MARSAYLHIPFCRTRCPYCDFAVLLDHKKEFTAPYVHALCREIEDLGPISREKLQTLYFGGGTPSLLDVSHWRQIFSSLQRRFRIDTNAEVTMELNPGTVDADKLQYWSRLGVNRLSIGVQTLQPELLRRLARGHSVEDVYNTIDLIRVNGFDNYSIDLIYGLPRQDLSDWQNTLQRALASPNLKHLSCYALSIEEGTPYSRMFPTHHESLPTEDTLVDMYELLQDMATGHGFVQYEVSNYALPGFESRHNWTYWQNEEFYGFGVSAHSFLAGKRYSHTRDTQAYISDPCHLEELPTDPAVEEMMLSLRTSKGLNLQSYSERYSSDLLTSRKGEIERMCELGLATLQGDCLKLTGKGFLLSNRLIAELLP